LNDRNLDVFGEQVRGVQTGVAPEHVDLDRVRQTDLLRHVKAGRDQRSFAERGRYPQKSWSIHSGIPPAVQTKCPGTEQERSHLVDGLRAGPRYLAGKLDDEGVGRDQLGEAFVRS
jgi:hypothetical protein